MSTAPESAVTPDKPANGAQIREPNLMRFGLRHLFIVFSLAAVMFALMATMGGAWPIVISSLAALIAAHLFGTALGTRLRDTSSEVQQWKSRPGSPDADEPVAPPQPVRVNELRLPVTTPLASFEKVGRWRRCCIAAGAAAGACLGLAGILIAGQGDVTLPGLALGAASCSILGGWTALLAVNFYSIARHTLRQATSEPRYEDLPDSVR
jgi:hypothetical protein